ncbi:MAG: hypothetical protein IVW55_09860 [Chloroflexi bacterium]|nr:hypothetical protein [Chloroflexota bacterium]
MASSQDPSYDSCWQGMVNGQFLSVKTGRQGRRGDISQGIITLSELGLDDRFHDIGTYLTPLRQGSVEMASMDGTRVYLVRSTTPQPPDVDVTPTPGVIFVFDLATRQWLDPNGTPIPSPTFTPTP